MSWWFLPVAHFIWTPSKINPFKPNPVMVVTGKGSDHKPQETTTNDHNPPARNHKLPVSYHNRPQTTRKLTQTSNKQTQTIGKRPQTTTLAYQTKNITICFFFPHPVITRTNRILKNIGIQWERNCAWLSQYLCGASKIGYACFGRLRT